METARPKRSRIALPHDESKAAEKAAKPKRPRKKKEIEKVAEVVVAQSRAEVSVVNTFMEVPSES